MIIEVPAVQKPVMALNVSQREEAGKRADVADPSHHVRGNKTADDKTRSPGRAEQAKRLVGIAFERAPQGQEQALEAVAKE